MNENNKPLTCPLCSRPVIHEPGEKIIQIWQLSCATQNTLTTEYHQKCFQKKQQNPTEKIRALDKAIAQTDDLLVRETLKLERRDLIEDSKSAAASSTEV